MIDVFLKVTLLSSYLDAGSSWLNVSYLLMHSCICVKTVGCDLFMHFLWVNSWIF